MIVVDLKLITVHIMSSHRYSKWLLDFVVTGNGIGMKIVGGKIIPGTEEVGAYVAAIYPGGIADQLHGELQEGMWPVEQLKFCIFVYYHTKHKEVNTVTIM